VRCLALEVLRQHVVVALGFVALALALVIVAGALTLVALLTPLPKTISIHPSFSIELRLVTDTKVDQAMYSCTGFEWSCLSEERRVRTCRSGRQSVIEVSMYWPKPMCSLANL